MQTVHVIFDSSCFLCSRSMFLFTYSSISFSFASLAARVCSFNSLVLVTLKNSFFQYVRVSFSSCSFFASSSSFCLFCASASFWYSSASRCCFCSNCLAVRGPDVCSLSSVLCCSVSESCFVVSSPPFCSFCVFSSFCLCSSISCILLLISRRLFSRRAAFSFLFSSIPSCTVFLTI